MQIQSKPKAWRKEILEHKYLLLFSIVLLIVAIFLESISGNYVAKLNGVSAPDLILDNIPTFDLDVIFIYGALFFVILFFVYPLFYRVKELHKAISQFSLLVLVRDAFVTFTHLAIPSSALKFSVPYWFPFLSYNNDLFFSGHTAFPFLGFLLFKGSKIRYVFLGLSIIMAAVVLMMHVHYTIDVFSAFFITYGTFKVGEWIFNKVNHYN